MAAYSTVIVTGANRGIGYAICEKILSQPSAGALTLYATSRAGSDLGLRTQDRQQVIYESLDINSPDSIQNLVGKLKQTGKPIDVLINNASVNLDNHFSYDNAKTTLNVNYRGTLAMCQAVLPLMQPQGGRIVNLSSTGSSLNSYSKPMQHRFRTIERLDDLESLMQEYENAVEQGRDTEAGFPSGRSYGVSKAATNVLTRVLAQENENLVVNCCCPGWVNTDMGNQVGRAPKTPEEGARIPVKLAFGDIEKVSGRYWANNSVSSRESGKVQQW